MFETQEFVEIILKQDGISRAGKIYVNNGTHMIIAPDAEDRTCFTVGAEVELVQLIEDCLYKMETEVVQCHEKGFAVRVVVARFSERRRAPRTRCTIGVCFHRKEAEEDGQDQVGVLYDISQGGARLLSPVFMPTTMMLAMEINLDGPMITPVVEVVRCVPLRASLMKKFSSCQFDIALKFAVIPRLDQVHLHRYLVSQASQEK